MAKKEEIKRRRKEVFQFICKYHENNSYPPTVREIADSLGIKSTSTVFSDIEALQSEGLLEKDDSKPRAIRVSSSNKQEELEGLLKHVYQEAIEVPIVGRVAAGLPITAEEHIDDYFLLPSRYTPSGECYMLRVSGDSMINVGIVDGDLILVEKTSTARNGQIVVAMIDGFESEATVKTFYDEGDHIRLQPENDSMSPIIVKNVTILGRVRGVFRYF